MANYPYYTEPTHDTGSAITLSAANAGKDTSVSSAEQRLIVDAVDKIFLLERTKNQALVYSNVYIARQCNMEE